MKTRLQLHSHANASKFALVMEGSAWREEFGSMEAAMQRAAMIVSDSTPVIVIDEYGTVILESTVHPPSSPA